MTTYGSSTFFFSIFSWRIGYFQYNQRQLSAEAGNASLSGMVSIESRNVNSKTGSEISDAITVV